MTDEPTEARSGAGAGVCYFLLAFPAAGAITLLFGMMLSAGPQNQFEGSGGMDVVLSMLMAYGVILAVICAAYFSLRRQLRALYIANGVMGVMTLWLLWSLSTHGLI